MPLVVIERYINSDVGLVTGHYTEQHNMDSQSSGDAASQGPQAPGVLDGGVTQESRLGPRLGAVLSAGPAGQPGQLQGARAQPLHRTSDVRVQRRLDVRGLLRGVPLSLDRRGRHQRSGNHLTGCSNYRITI